MKRPKRWDVPFGEEMTADEVERLLRLDIFSEMDRMRFPKSCSLEDILRNDARVVHFETGDIIVREGDYGSSAFLILHGSTRVAIDALPRATLGRSPIGKKGIFQTLLQGLFPSAYAEVRTYGQTGLDRSLGQRVDGNETRVFLQDVPGVVDRYHTVRLGPGEIFGELAAMSRTPRTATVFADESTALLEIRWQGLRDIMKRNPGLKARINALYRANSLETHLSETPILKRLPEDTIHQIADATVFETHGNFEWHTQFERTKREEASQRIHAEPLICEEGHSIDGLVLVRSGFARISRRYGDGHRTRAYLAKGHLFGLEEIVFNWKYGRQRPWHNSLRTVGYVDILRIPVCEIERQVLTSLPESVINQLVSMADAVLAEPSRAEDEELETGLLEFVLDQRVLNGTQTMLIDTNRCTRCDDCVRACAATHDNNPRFTREGPRYDNYMVAHACMHCADPVCMIGCPSGAIGREIMTGTMLINDLTCIGCGICARSCPYENIKMVETRSPDGQFIRGEDTFQPIVKATKCDLCSGHWGGPACQRACPHDALVRIDLNDESHLLRWMKC